MALANGWVIACPKDCAGDSDALGDCTLYIEYFKRIKDVPGKKDNTPGRPNNGEVRDTLASGWFEDAGRVDEFGKQPWYPYRNRIREVVVLDTWVPESGKYLFDGLTQCKSFDLLKLDTSNCTTLEGMFRGCSSVTELFDLDRLDTSNVENTSYMFLNCLALKAVSISGWKASKISDVNQMLGGCSTYILATEEQREFLNKITGSTQHGIWTRNLS